MPNEFDYDHLKPSPDIRTCTAIRAEEAWFYLIGVMTDVDAPTADRVAAAAALNASGDSERLALIQEREADALDRIAEAIESRTGTADDITTGFN